MSENVVTLSRTARQKHTVLLKNLHRDATALFNSAQKEGDKETRKKAAEIIGLASYELRKLEGVR